MDRYTISSFKHGAVLVNAIQNMGITPNLQMLLDSGSGSVDPTFVSIGQANPEISFSTHAIKTALAGLGGINGIAMNDDYFFLQKMLDGGLRGAAESHIKATCVGGILIPQTLTANQGAAAELSYRGVLVSDDGSTSPLTLTAAQSLDSGQDLVGENYTMGPITINGTTLDGVESWSLNFGLNLDIILTDGDVYPTAVGILSRVPVITAKTSDVTKFSSWGITGVAQTDTDSTVVLYDQTAGGARGSAPITFSIDAGIAYFTDITGPQGQRYGGQVTIQPISDGTAAILAVAGLT